MHRSFSPEAHQVFSESDASTSWQPQNELLTRSQISHIESAFLENHIGNLLLLTEDNQILYATDRLESRLKTLIAPDSNAASLPQEIAFISQILQQCRHRFPSQSWVMEFDILTKDAIALRIRSRWLKLEEFEHPCILFIIEDRQRLLQEMVLDEAHDLGLTPREQEVWLLQREGATYRQIAEKLHITTHTVKKHMRSIYAKQKTRSAQTP